MSGELKDLEAMMGSMAELDAASAEISVDGEIDLEDMIPEMEDIPSEVVLLNTKEATIEQSDAIDDYNKARSHLSWALEANQKMIVNNAKLCTATTHPKNFEMHQRLIEAHVKLATALLGSSGKVSENKVKSKVAAETSPVLPPGDEGLPSTPEKDSELVLSRRPSSSAVFQAVEYGRKVVKEGGQPLTNEQISKLALKISENTEEGEEIEVKEYAVQI